MRLTPRGEGALVIACGAVALGFVYGYVVTLIRITVAVFA